MTKKNLEITLLILSLVSAALTYYKIKKMN